MNLVFFGRTMPTTWLVTLDAVVSVSFLAGAVAFWRLWAKRFKEPSEIAKITLGLALSAVGALCLAMAGVVSAAGGKASIGWVLAFEFFNSAGFANVFPVGLAMYARVSPQAVAGTIMGVLLPAPFRVQQFRRLARRPRGEDVRHELLAPARRADRRRQPGHAAHRPAGRAVDEPDGRRDNRGGPDGTVTVMPRRIPMEPSTPFRRPGGRLLAAVWTGLVVASLAHAQPRFPPMATPEEAQAQSNAAMGMLGPYLNEIGYAHLEKRATAVQAIQSRADAERRQAEVRAKIISLVGGIPKAGGPVEVRTFGATAERGFTVERIAYASCPDYWVTANVFVPQGKGPFPAVVITAGHGRVARPTCLRGAPRWRARACSC